MKKVFFSALSFVMFATVAANAQSTPAAPATETAAVTAQTKANDRTAVTADQLPAAIKTTLATDAYKEWTVASAFLVKAEKEYYEIQAVKGDEKITMKFDKEGNAL